MKLDVVTAFADALQAARRDSAVLLPLAGLTMFLPQYAVYLLVPRMALPVDMGSDPAAQQAAVEAMAAWLGRYGGWSLLAPLCGLFGGLAVMALYLAPERPTVGRALVRAAALLLRYVLATILIGFAAVPIVMVGLASPLLIAVLMPLAFYVLGRTMLMGPAIVGAAPLGAVAAIRRSWMLTRGHGWMLGATYAAPVFVAQLIGGGLLALSTSGGGNPVIVAIFDGLAALVMTVTALALALVETTLYRRFASIGR